MNIIGQTSSDTLKKLKFSNMSLEQAYPETSPLASQEMPQYGGEDPGGYTPQGRILYWYHPDYIQNVDLITDIDGAAYELFLYNPWGEQLHHWTSSSSSWTSPYRFNAKELDPETGLSYYGARYYQSKLGVWLSVDPKSADAPGWTPYRGFFNNPLNYIDPDGQWEKDANGNLVAENGDNAWTLAKYLNTSSEIAIKMLGEQGYSVNDNGILNLKIGDVFQVEQTSGTPESREDLGFLGNEIRDRAGSEFSKNLFENYWKGDGDVELSGKRFAGILMYMKENNTEIDEGSPVSLRGTSGNKFPGTKSVVDFYNSSEYSLAFGKATVYSNSKGNVVGFYDHYNFDSKPLGTRSTTNEIKTRAVRNASPSTAKSFSIRYGYSGRQ
jgi:RHS repeat-associated protein